MDIERLIETNLIVKLKTINLKKLKKTQNIFRLLNIHETLLDILYLMDNYDSNSGINSLICEALYQFSQNNLLNQKILKKKFDFFLDRVKNVSFYKVLIQSVNLIKVIPSKSRKYISKIFDRFEIENMEENIEILTVLKAFTFNFNGENLSDNQVKKQFDIRKLYLSVY